MRNELCEPEPGKKLRQDVLERLDHELADLAKLGRRRLALGLPSLTGERSQVIDGRALERPRLLDHRPGKDERVAHPLGHRLGVKVLGPVRRVAEEEGERSAHEPPELRDLRPDAGDVGETAVAEERARAAAKHVDDVGQAEHHPFGHRVGLG